MAIAVEIRNNLILSPRMPPPVPPLTINQYSTVVVAVWNRAQSLATEFGHHVVGVHHFISALFAENDARAQLRAAGYADDNDEIRRHRHSLFGSQRVAPIELPGKRLIESDRLQAWLKAAKEVAERREPELQTITIGDFLLAVAEDEVLAATELKAIQAVLASYKRPHETPFPTRVGLRFDDLDKHLDRQDAEAERNREIITAAVGAVGARVEAVKADTTVLVKALPGEMRLSTVLMGLAFTLAVLAGVSVGLATRWHFGVL